MRSSGRTRVRRQQPGKAASRGGPSSPPTARAHRSARVGADLGPGCRPRSPSGTSDPVRSASGKASRLPSALPDLSVITTRQVRPSVPASTWPMAAAEARMLERRSPGTSFASTFHREQPLGPGAGAPARLTPRRAQHDMLALIGDLRAVAVPRTTRNFRSASWERGAGSRRSPLVALSRVMVLDNKRRETLPLGPRHVRAGNIYSVALGSPAARGDLPPPPTVLSKDRAYLCPLQTLNDVLAVIDALGCGCEDPRVPRRSGGSSGREEGNGEAPE